MGHARAPTGELRRLLSGVGYDETAVSSVFNCPSERVIGRTGYFSVTRADDLESTQAPVPLLLCMFLLGRSVREGTLRGALGSDLSLLEQLKLTREQDGRFVPLVSITPLRNRILIADRLLHNEPFVQLVVDTSAVMPPHASSLALLRDIEPFLESPKPLLDIGCGCGSLGLVLSDSFPRVTGIDINARAVSYATMNAAINQIVTASFVRKDATQETPAGNYGMMIFNSPWILNLPSYPPSRSHLPAWFAFLEVMRPKIEAGAVLRLSAVLAIRQSLEEETELLRARCGPHVALTLTAHRDSPFSIPQEYAERQMLPPGSYLVARSISQELFEATRIDGIREVVFITIRMERCI